MGMGYHIRGPLPSHIFYIYNIDWPLSYLHDRRRIVTMEPLCATFKAGNCTPFTRRPRGGHDISNLNFPNSFHGVAYVSKIETVAHILPMALIGGGGKFG